MTKLAEIRSLISSSELTTTELLALNKMIVDRLKVEQQKATFEFSFGDKVSFKDRQGRTLKGEVVGRTPKSVKVLVPGAVVGGEKIGRDVNWTVSASFLTKVA